MWSYRDSVFLIFSGASINFQRTSKEGGRYEIFIYSRFGWTRNFNFSAASCDHGDCNLETIFEDVKWS